MTQSGARLSGFESWSYHFRGGDLCSSIPVFVKWGTSRAYHIGLLWRSILLKYISLEQCLAHGEHSMHGDYPSCNRIQPPHQHSHFWGCTACIHSAIWNCLVLGPPGVWLISLTFKYQFSPCKRSPVAERIQKGARHISVPSACWTIN